MSTKRILASLLLALFVLAASPMSVGQVAVRAETLHTMAGPPIEDGVVVITKGRIVAVGPASEVSIPEGHELLRAAVATPGLVDVRATAGLSGIYNVDHDQDQLESSKPIQPQLRALDAYNAREELVAYLRSFGITTLHTGHAPGELISGRTLIVKTRGETVEEALVMEGRALAATLGPRAQKSGAKSPGTRGKSVAMLREALIDAREYAAKRAAAVEGEKPARDLELEALAAVLEGELPLAVTANRAQDIASALRLADEFGFTLWLDMAAEAPLLIDEIKQAGVPVLLHPTMYRTFGETENLSFTTAARLADAGIPFAIQSGFEGYVPKTRVVLFEAAVAAAYGLGFERALAAVTIDAARILGIDDRVGSLEVGKEGDVALYEGNPFEPSTRCVGTVIEGEVVSRLKR